MKTKPRTPKQRAASRRALRLARSARVRIRKVEPAYYVAERDALRWLRQLSTLARDMCGAYADPDAARHEVDRWRRALSGIVRGTIGVSRPARTP